LTPTRTKRLRWPSRQAPERGSIRAMSRRAVVLMGDHPGAGKVQDAGGELDLAIRDVRNVVFDLRQPDPPS
jgi:hypothetical protein